MGRSDKETLEVANATMFLELFNGAHGTQFSIIKHGDAPDFECADESSGDSFALEMTMTQDRELDIAARSGRSESRSVRALREQLEAVREGKATALEGVDTPENWNEQLARCLEAKAAKDYGKNVALAIRDVSPMRWDVDHARIAEVCRRAAPRFGRGLWLFNEFGKIQRLDT